LAGTLALTGATGFVGGHLLDAALAGGWRVQALARRPQPPRHGVDWVAGDLDAAGALDRLCAGADAAIHVAGAINAPDRAAFARANIDGTAAMLAAARAAGVGRFVQVSSLAAREPGLSDYGWSKAGADRLVAASGLDWTIIRPPAVYGPGDRETLQLFRAAKAGIVPVVGRGRFSIIHVADLARALLAAAGAPALRHATHEVDDATPDGFDQAGFARAIGRAMGVAPRIVRLPTALLGPAARLAEGWAGVVGGRARLSRDRARYFAHPDWIANRAPLAATGLWAPRVAAAPGLRETAGWYRREGWL
jgi:nucleoside-diphosphate-sugar epimerase